MNDDATQYAKNGSHDIAGFILVKLLNLLNGLRMHIKSTAAIDELESLTSNNFACLRLK